MGTGGIAASLNADEELRENFTANEISPLQLSLLIS